MHSSPAAALALLDLVQSHRITQVIYVAAKLDLAERMRDGPRSVHQLAREVGVDEDALRRLLAALAAVGACARASDGSYALTEIGAALDSANPHSFKGWAIFEGEVLLHAWSGMIESVRSGKTNAELQGAASSFELMARHPKVVAIFNDAMADLTRLVTPQILDAYDFGRFGHWLDVGGGSGELIGQIARKHPKLRGTVFDLPRCAEAASAHLDKIGVADRAAFVAGDFFQQVPRIAEAIVLKSVIHDWNDERSMLILRNCRAALPANGTLLLIERILAEPPGATADDRSNVMSDLNMLRGLGGRERTRREYDSLLSQSGFRLMQVYPAGRFNVIESQVA